MLRLLARCCARAVGKAGKALHLGGEGALGRLCPSVPLRHQVAGEALYGDPNSRTTAASAHAHRNHQGQQTSGRWTAPSHTAGRTLSRLEPPERAPKVFCSPDCR